METKLRKYQIQNKLGQGSYGVIFKAINRQSCKVCVLKQIKLTRMSQRARKNAINQATIMGKLNHPFIVRYIQSFIDDNCLNIVMEYCDNRDLSVFLQKQNKKPLKQDKIWQLFIPICMGLQYIHRNKILHRDIKTLNIFLNKNQNVKIGDLGVAKMLNSQEFAQTMVGTPFYLSPELCQEKPYNQKSDIWALGCLLYQLCTYRHPFQATNQASLILKIVRGKYAQIPEFYSKQLKDMIDMCLERDYKRRPTAQLILSKLSNIYSQISEVKEMIELYKFQQIVKLSYEQSNSIVKICPQNKEEVQKNKKSAQKLKNTAEVKKKQRISEKQLQGANKQIRKNQKQGEVIKKDHEDIKKESKEQFVTNLNKMIQMDQKIDKKDKLPKEPLKKPVYMEIPWKPEIKNKPEQNYKQHTTSKQNISNKQQNSNKDEETAQQVPQHNQKQKQRPSSQRYQVKPSNGQPPNKIISNNGKVSTPSLHDNKYIQKVSLIKETQPVPFNVKQTEEVIKVKMSKPVVSKLYQLPPKPIKSGGFPPNIEQQKQIINQNNLKTPLEKKRKPPLLSNQKESRNRVSVQQIKYQEQIASNNKKQSDVYLFRKKSNQIANKIPCKIHQDYKPEKHSNTKNTSKHSIITKEERDMVINLPDHMSDSSNGSPRQQKVNQNKQSVICTQQSSSTHIPCQKVQQDITPIEVYQHVTDEEVSEFLHSKVQQQNQHSKVQQTQNQHYNQIEQSDSETNSQQQQQQSYQEVQGQNQDEEEPDDESIYQVNKLQLQRQQQEVTKQYTKEQEQEQWSFDQQPELPLLQEKQMPYFQQMNPYLVEEQFVEEKKNQLELKLQENIKREDQINKLMQIKIIQCRHLVPNDFQQVLQFFRTKINMDAQYSQEDEVQVDNFLRRKKLTDYHKFQNIYKIMHFEMELQNSRKIIQRICKKLQQLQKQC